MSSSNNDQIIINYIYEHEGCTKIDMNNDLTHFYPRDDTQKKIRKYMSQKTLRSRLNWLSKVNHIIKSGNNYFVNKEKLSNYPDIWNKKQIEFADYKKDREKQIEMLKYYVDDDILRRSIKKNTKTEIFSRYNSIYLSNEMQELFNDLIYSILIECFLNNPDHWLKFQKPEDLDFKITINANWSNDPKILGRLNERKAKCFKDHYLYPFGNSKFHKWGIENNESSRKQRIANKTEEDLFNKAFTEDQFRKDEITRYKQKIIELKPLFLKRLDKELQDIISPEENKIAIKKLRKLVENEYIDFDEDVILYWEDIGKPNFVDRTFYNLDSIVKLVLYDKDLQEPRDEIPIKEKWRSDWQKILEHGDFKSKPIKLNKKFPDVDYGFDDLINEMKRRYPEKMQRIEEQADFEFLHFSIRSLMNKTED